MTNDVLFQPFQLGPLTLRNRIVSTSHEPSYTEDGMPKDRYRLYHLEKARGGIGMTMIGGSAVVSKDSSGVFGNIDMTTDEVVPWLKKLSDDVHAEGVPVMIQLTHLGLRSTNFQGDWLPIIGPGRARETAHGSFTKTMEDFDIKRVIADFAAAAKRAADGGLDGLEIAHLGHLVDMFTVERFNDRDDEYGGSYENRIKFSTEIIDAIIAAVPSDFVVGVKMTGEEFLGDEGMTKEAAVPLVNHWAEHGIKFLNITTGHIESEAALAGQIPGMGTPAAPFLDIARYIREGINIPVIHATRITDSATARFALESGAVDLVGMIRQNLVDPHFSNKVKEGRDDDVRPCVGANACLDGIYASGSAICIHNPATGREAQYPHEITEVSPRAGKKVVIVGAGPAGLEAARVAALRGHSVIVFEADGTHGGQVNIAAKSDRRRDLIGIVDWRFQQAKKRNVEFRFGVLAEADDVLAENPDVVIIATGGVPDTDIGDIRSQVSDTWDVMQDQLKGKTNVMVFDDNGQNPGVDAVEKLARGGAKVTYVTRDRMVASQVGEMNGPAYMKVFSEFGVNTILGEGLVATAKGEGGQVVATLRNEYSGLETQHTFDAVVIERGTIPNDELYLELRDQSKNRGEVNLDAFIAADSQESVMDRNPEGSFELYRIGDAVVSRNIHAAILEGIRVGHGL